MRGSVLLALTCSACADYSRLDLIADDSRTLVVDILTPGVTRNSSGRFRDRPARPNGRCEMVFSGIGEATFEADGRKMTVRDFDWLEVRRWDATDPGMDIHFRWDREAAISIWHEKDVETLNLHASSGPGELRYTYGAMLVGSAEHLVVSTTPGPSAVGSRKSAARATWT